jgi:hypothetical protein
MPAVRRFLQNDGAVFAAVWLLVAAVGLFFYWHLREQPFFYDALGYVNAANDIADRGLLSKWEGSHSRSYGYPLFLTAALKLAHVLNARETTGIFLLQWPLFVGTAWLAATTLFRARRVQLIAFAAVAANPLLVTYAPQAFSESLTLSCILFTTAALGRAARSASTRSTAVWLVAGAAVISYAVAVRPGTILIPPFYAIAAGAILVSKRRGAPLLPAVATAALVVVALIVPLLPQMAINHRHYDSSSPVPTYDLANLQAQYGLLLARYATNVSNCGKPQLEFPNPHPTTVPLHMTSFDAIRYYTTTWPDGPVQMVLHVFSGFDPRPFLVDQRDFGTYYERVFQALTLALLFLAGAGLPRAVRRMRGAPDGFRADAAFLGVTAVIFVGVLATSAAEYRFGAVPLIAVSLLAAYGASLSWRPSRGAIALLGVSYVSALLLWITFSDLLLSTSKVWQQCS